MITASYYHDCHGAIVVYDVTDEDTAESVGNWMGEITRFSNIKATIPVLVCGNKTDLEQTVKEEDVRERVGQREHTDYALTSIYKKETVADAYLKLIRLSIPFYEQIVGPKPDGKKEKQKKGCTIL